MHFTIHSIPNCRNCTYAKLMMEDFECTFDEVSVAPEHRRSLCNSAGVSSFPVIYLGETLVGGFRELGKFLEENIKP